MSEKDKWNVIKEEIKVPFNEVKETEKSVNERVGKKQARKDVEGQDKEIMKDSFDKREVIDSEAFLETSSSPIIPVLQPSEENETQAEEPRSNEGGALESRAQGGSTKATGEVKVQDNNYESVPDQIYELAGTRRPTRSQRARQESQRFVEPRPFVPERSPNLGGLGGNAERIFEKSFDMESWRRQNPELQMLDAGFSQSPEKEFYDNYVTGYDSGQQAEGDSSSDVFRDDFMLRKVRKKLFK